jgi:CheY-like chemotaxis protein
MLDFEPQRELPDVLLIDDDLVSREVTATLLTMIGHAVHTAESGSASLQMIATGAVDPGIVLMDAQMPGLQRRFIFSAAAGLPRSWSPRPTVFCSSPSALESFAGCSIMTSRSVQRRPADPISTLETRSSGRKSLSSFGN